MNVLTGSRVEKILDGGRYGRAIRKWVNPPIRRAFDVLFASLGLLILLPFFLFVALIIKLDSPGPVFFWGSRMGRSGKPFRMLKFRTMYENADSYKGPRITGSGDPRITVVGHWLRDTKLNELPQLWNVLIGDMSLVGPRPEDPAYVLHWPEDTLQLLLSVRPGMTSPASIVYRDEEEMLSANNVEEEYLQKILPEKLELDSRYVRRRSVLGDIDILFWTAVVLIPALRRRRIPDQHLLWGPVAHFASRYFSWFFVDAMVVFGVVAVTGLIWRSTGPFHVGVGTSLLLALLATMVFSVVNYIFGLSRIYWSNANAGYILALFASALIATIGMLLVNDQLPVRLPAIMLIVVGLLAWLGFIVVRYRLRLVSGAAQHWLNMRPGTGLIGERALIVGAGVVGRFAASLLSNDELLPAFSVVGGVDDNARRRDAQISGFRILGTTADVPKLVSKYDIEVIVFAIASLEFDHRQRILDSCEQTSARVIIMPEIVEAIQTKFVGVPQDESLTKQPPNPGSMFSKLDQLLQEDRVAEARELISAVQAEEIKV